MTNASESYANRGPLDDKEITAMLEEADKISNVYFKLRVKALIGLLKKFGKRRIENLTLKLSDLEVKEGYLYVTFTLVKKHKKGLFQYIKQLKKETPSMLEKPHNEIERQWKAWQQTERGYRVKLEKRTKKVSCEDYYAKLIIEYLEYLKEKVPNCIFLFPSGKAIFQNYMIIPDKHLSGRQLLRLIKPLNRKAWLHLFRDHVAAKIARDSGDTIRSIYEIRDTLDLEKEETAYNYVRRYGIQEVKAETDAK
jgi:hypothetical protein